jgi:hypothetical protein
MKSILTTISLFLLTFSCLYAQAPKLLNYQAIARNANGEPQANQPLTVVFDIYEGSPAGNIIYNEAHSTTTAPTGLFNLMIGSKNPQSFSAINWSGGPKYLQVTVNGVTGGATQLLSVPYALYAETAGNGGASLTAGDGITINNGAINANDPSATNEIQVLSLNGNQLNLSNGGGSVTLASGTDSQTLSVNGNQLSISNGNSVSLPQDGDGNSSNEIQTLSLNGNQLNLSNGGGSVTLSAGTDSQTLSVSGNQISISNGNSVTIPQDGDGSSSNEIQTLSLNGNQLSLSNGGGSVTLSGGSDSQTLTVNGNQLTISNGNSVNIDSSPTNEIQSISLSGNQLSLSNGGGSVVLPPDGDGNPTNEIQTISLSGNQLSLSNGGGTVTLSQGGTDSQTLSLNGNQLSITNGNSVTLPAGTNYLAGPGININGNTITNTGDSDNSTTNEIQTLSLSGNQLSLSNGGGSVTLASGTDSQNLFLNGNQLSITNGNSVTLPAGTTYTAGPGINISGNSISANDNSASNELQSLSINGNQLTISNGNSVQLPSGNSPYITINSNGPGTTCGTGFLPFDCIQCSPGYSSFKVTNNCDGNAIHGVANSSAGIKAGVFGEALGFEGNGVWGECNVGADAWGIYGKSSSGYGVVGYTGNTSGGSTGAAGLFNHRIVVANVGQFAFDSWAFNPHTIVSWSGVFTSSDKRFKKDIEPVAYGLKEVMKMNPVTYRWKAEEGQGKKSIGFIAQEMKEIVPDVVLQLDKDDNPVQPGQDSFKNSPIPSEDETKLSMNYTELTPVLVKAIQEQQNQIEDLKAQLKAKDDLMAQFAQELAGLKKLVKPTTAAGK